MQSPSLRPTGVQVTTVIVTRQRRRTGDYYTPLGCSSPEAYRRDKLGLGVLCRVTRRGSVCGTPETRLKQRRGPGEGHHFPPKEQTVFLKTKHMRTVFSHDVQRVPCTTVPRPLCHTCSVPRTEYPDRDWTAPSAS